MTSFLSSPRLAKGHVLVIPNRHLETPCDLNDAETESIFREVRRLQARMLGEFALGVDQWQKTRLMVKESKEFKVSHVHFHLLPSNPGDEMYDKALVWKLDNFEELTAREMDEMVAFLR